MRRFTIIVALACAFAYLSRQIAPTVSDIYALSAPSIVKVERLTGGSGSGFYVQGPSGRLIVTNAHVCDGERVMRIRPSFNGAPFEALVKQITYIDDLCTIVVPDGDKHPALPIAKREAVSGSPVYAVGHPMGSPLSVTPGILIGEQQVDIAYPASFCLPGLGEMVATIFGEPFCGRQMRGQQITAKVIPGNSGGPLLNERGEVIGVDFATDELGGNALPLRMLKAIISLS